MDVDAVAVLDEPAAVLLMGGEAGVAERLERTARGRPIQDRPIVPAGQRVLGFRFGGGCW